jgi:hypothetical protein
MQHGQEEGTCRQGMRTLSLLTRSEASDLQGALGIQREMCDLDNSRGGGTQGENPLRQRPMRLSMVIVESAGLGVEQAWAGGQQGVGRTLCRKHAVDAMQSIQR